MNTVINRSKKALIFFSSPNENSYTKKLLDIVLAALPDNIEFETINVFDLDVNPCIDCKACFDVECPFNDDGMGELLDKIQMSDIVIAATPIYFNSVPSKFKAIFDRMQQIFVKKVILNKPVFITERVGILLTTAGSCDDFATTSINAMFKMFFNSINAEFIEHIAIQNTDNIKEICIDEMQLSNIKNHII